MTDPIEAAARAILETDPYLETDSKVIAWAQAKAAIDAYHAAEAERGAAVKLERLWRASFLDTQKDCEAAEAERDQLKARVEELCVVIAELVNELSYMRGLSCPDWAGHLATGDATKGDVLDQARAALEKDDGH